LKWVNLNGERRKNESGGSFQYELNKISR